MLQRPWHSVSLSLSLSYCLSTPDLVLGVGSSKEELDARSNAGDPKSSADRGSDPTGVEDVHNVEQGPGAQEQSSVEVDGVLGNTSVERSKLFRRRRMTIRIKSIVVVLACGPGLCLFVPLYPLSLVAVKKKKLSIDRIAWHIQFCAESAKST